MKVALIAALTILRCFVIKQQQQQQQQQQQKRN